ncbi:hypothetical protein HW555_009085 [Spodoptera exigua]|uniref:Uncharacterized protein n=1 Tax=Spodoptera exigua TaxID=7107 RepID=A0A835G9L4_SPOEX|nr:hypothetical protein HW555_009085 [Spodoptera exigua]
MVESRRPRTPSTYSKPHTLLTYTHSSNPNSEHDSGTEGDSLSHSDQGLHSEGVPEHAEQVSAQEQRSEHRGRAEHAVHVLTLVVRFQLVEQVFQILKMEM